VKRCPKCGITKPLGEFHVDRSKANGHMSACKDCDNAKRKRSYDPKRSRQRYLAQLEEAGKAPRIRKAPHGNPHGGAIEWARMYDEQQGLCYLCLRPLPDDRSKVHVDHDHSCCDPGPRGRRTRSCQYCRRGLTHERCNQIWGLAAEDPELLRVMASQGERVGEETRQRIAAKPWEQPLLLL
jgi:hypothetical protein